MIIQLQLPIFIMYKMFPLHQVLFVGAVVKSSNGRSPGGGMVLWKTNCKIIKDTKYLTLGCYSAAVLLRSEGTVLALQAVFDWVSQPCRLPLASSKCESNSSETRCHLLNDSFLTSVNIVRFWFATPKTSKTHKLVLSSLWLFFDFSKYIKFWFATPKPSETHKLVLSSIWWV